VLLLITLKQAPSPKHKDILMIALSGVDTLQNLKESRR